MQQCHWNTTLPVIFIKKLQTDISSHVPLNPCDLILFYSFYILAAAVSGRLVFFVSDDGDNVSNLKKMFLTCSILDLIMKTVLKNGKTHMTLTNRNVQCSICTCFPLEVENNGIWSNWRNSFEILGDTLLVRRSIPPSCLNANSLFT